jgi:hypothetical protein
MRGNSHVRFLGEEVTVRSSPYPTYTRPRATLAAQIGAEEATRVAARSGRSYHPSSSRATEPMPMPERRVPVTSSAAWLRAISPS